MKTTRKIENDFYIMVDRKGAEAKLLTHYNCETVDEVEVTIKREFRSREEIEDLITETLNFDVKYGLRVLHAIFPDLFSDKRFLNRLKKYLKD